MPNFNLNIDSEYRTFDHIYYRLFERFKLGKLSLKQLDKYRPKYISDVDTWTSPISVQISEGIENINKTFLLHPNTHIPKKYWKHDSFESPFAPLDYIKQHHGYEWEKTTPGVKRDKSVTLTLWWFWSLQDPRFLFANDDDYLNMVLPYIQFTRRSSTELDQKIPLPFKIYMPEDKSGKMRWHYVNLQIRDISAMQGKDSLNTYASNVGLMLAVKDCYDQNQQKARMDVKYMENAELFTDYSLGDLPIQEIASLTTSFYNKVATLIGIEEREKWGMSTGIVVASMASAWLAKQLKVSEKTKYMMNGTQLKEVPTKDVIDNKTKTLLVPALYRLTELASQKKLNALSYLLNKKELVYLGMTDGGRAVKERPHIQTYPFDNLGTKETLLIDIDIAGCYGNGLANQDFAVGQPTIDPNAIQLGEWELKYKKQLEAGLWTARISWENAPFKQDILISKTEEKLTNWDFAVAAFNTDFSDDDYELDSEEKVYDANMFLATDSVHKAALTHDSYQVLMSRLPNVFKKWLRANAVIESFAGYLKRDETDEITDDMFDGGSFLQTTRNKSQSLKWSTKWVRISLKPLLDILLNERSKHKKKTPMNVFLKLIINCVYGCIASSYFSDNGTGISNYIIGNNITARARTLAWCMAKGFHSFMTVTDGGVFDFNKVLKYNVQSIGIFEQVSEDNFIRESDKVTVVEQISLAGEQINASEFIKWCVSQDNSLIDIYEKNADKEKHPNIESWYMVPKNGEELMKPVNKIAWEHLKGIFSDLDIFKYDQFKFECKNWYTKMELHSKVDYRLTNELNENKVIALRGKRMRTLEQKVNGNMLFDAVSYGTAIVIEEHGEEMIGFNEWKESDKKHYPHDAVVKTKRFYSITPLGVRYIDKVHFKRVAKRYEDAKQTLDANQIATVDLT